MTSQLDIPLGLTPGEPTAELISLELFRDHHAKLSTHENSAYLQLLLTAARRRAERESGCTLLTATHTLVLDAFPDEIVLPRPPLQAVNSLVYRATDGEQRELTEATVSGGDFEIDTTRRPGRLRPAYGKSWPATRPTPNAVIVEYEAGYGDAPEDVPADLRLGVLQLAAHWARHREPVNVGNIVTPLPLMFKELFRSYRHRMRV